MNVKIESAIVKNLTSQNKYDAIKEFIYKIPFFHECTLKEKLTETVIQRERIMSTGLGYGVAIAHGKLHSVKSIYIGLGISRRGIEYNSIDGKPVHFLFLVVHHPDQRNSYLKVLSTIANLVKHTLIKGRMDTDTILRLEPLVCSFFSDKFCIMNLNQFINSNTEIAALQ